MIVYQGIMPNFNFRLDGYTYHGELCETQFEDCQLVSSHGGFFEYPVERVNLIKGTLRTLVNTKTKEVRALTLTTQMRLTAENFSNYEHSARFILPIEIFKAVDVKKALKTHVLACLLGFQSEIVDKMSEINGAWFDHNKELYDQFIDDESIDALNPKFYPESENSVYDVFNHTNIGLNRIGKSFIGLVLVFCQSYNLDCADQVDELFKEFKLPLLVPFIENRLSA